MASGTQELDRFVRDALARGVPRPEIEKALLDAGWSAERARSALGAFADLPFAVPVPRPRPSLSAREAFLYLTLFSALYVTAYHVGSVCFDLITRALPDPSDPAGRVFHESLRWSASSVIIAFPVFLLLTRFVAREMAHDPTQRLSPVRRWLTYLTLFVAALVLIGNLTTLVHRLLGGEITTRFVLKVLVVGAIAGTIFGYYLHDLRREETD
jgi:hypothetical protein